MHAFASQRGRGAAWVIAVYLAALAVASLCVVALAGNPLTAAAVADLAATVVVFAFSRALRNSSLYDPYWSVAPPVLVLYWWLQSAAGFHPLAWLAFVLTCLWAVRLTANWASGWQGLMDEDWRYRRLQQQLGFWYWPVSLLGIHLLPTAVVFVGVLPVFALLQSQGEVAWGWALLGAAVGLSAVALETQADRQLRRFREVRTSPDQLLTTGVWGWCRHPNYLGELGFWLSLGLLARAAGVSWWLSSVGFLVMLGLFVVVSIPMIENKLLAAKPGYAQYRARTFALLPVGLLVNRKAGS